MFGNRKVSGGDEQFDGANDLDTESILKAIKNQESFTLPYNMYRNGLLNLLQLEYNDYIVEVNDKVIKVGGIIKSGEKVNIVPKIKCGVKNSLKSDGEVNKYMALELIEDLMSEIQK